MIPGAFIDLGLALFYALCCACAGNALLGLPGLARLRPEGEPAAFASAFILGMGVLSQLLMLAGLAAGFTPWMAATILALALLAGARATLGAPRAAIEGAAGAWRQWRGATLLWKAAALIALAYAAGLLLGALLLPPTGDAEAFYFVFPKFVAGARRLAPMPGDFAAFSSIGLVGEMHFAAILLYAGPPAAKAFAWLVALSACWMLLQIGRACGLGPRGRLVAALLVLTSTTFTAYVTDGKVDLFAAVLGLAACYWALQAGRDAQGNRPALLAGALTGLACIAKISYIPTLVPGVLLILAMRQPSPWRRDALARWAIPFCVAAAIAFAPHLVKNAAFFGQPLAPFYPPGSGTALNQVWFSPEATRWIVMTYPLALVFGQYPMQGGTLSYLALALAPLAIFLRRPARWRDSNLALVTLAGLLGMAIWLVLRPSVLAPRYHLASLLLLFLLPSRALEHLALEQPGAKILKAAIAGSFALTLLVLVQPLWALAKEARGFLRAPMPACYRASPYCEALLQVNARTPPGGRIFLGTFYAYWLRPDLLACRSTVDDVGIRLLPDPAARWAELYARGFETLVMDKTSHAQILARFDPAAAPAWLEVRAVPASGPLVVYAIASRDPARKPSRACRARAAGGWEVVPLPAG